MTPMDFNRDIEDHDLIFLDVETTGLDAVTGDAICEICLVKFRRRRQLSLYNTFINPQVPVSVEAQSIHKIPPEELAKAPVFGQVAQEIESIMAQSVLCAYNARFDVGFLNEELRRLNRPPLEHPVVDVYGMAKKNLRLQRYNLETVARHLEVQISGLHRAAQDAALSAEVFFRLLDGHKARNIKNLGDFLGLYGFNNAAFQDNAQAKALGVKQALATGSLMKIKWFLSGTVKEEQVRPINLCKQSDVLYLLASSLDGQSLQIPLNHVLAVQVVSN
jgi:DNA polymerase III subunit epsilon